MAGYEQFATIARRLIQKRGRTVTLVEPSTTPADPAKPWRGPNDATPTDELEVKAVIFPGVEEDSETPGVRVQGAGFALIEPPATGEDVTLYHTLNDRDVPRRLSEIGTLDPGDGGPVLFWATLGGGA
jgi:hypothetical protein